LAKKILFLANKNNKNNKNTAGANKGNPYGKVPPTKSNIDTNETDTVKKFCL
jgi:hypothetical protein